MGSKTVVQAPAPPPKDTTMQDYLEYQGKKEDRLDYRDWAASVQDYKAKKGQQQAGRAGWQDHKNLVQNQLQKGLLTYNEAQNQLTDYADKYKLAANTITRPGEDPRKGWREADRPDSFDEIPEYETPEQWQSWSPNQAKNTLQQFYTGTGDIDPVTGETDRGILGRRQDIGVEAAYQDLLGRDATSDELASARDRFSSGYYKDIDSLKSTLTQGSEYTDKFQDSYLANYYDTQFGKELRDDEGKRTGKRKFSFDSTLLPSYGEETERRTGVTLPNFGDSFTGTPGEIDFQLDNVRQTRDYIFNSGLTSLQGDINKNIAELKVEGQKEMTRIAKEGDIYSGLVGSFNFS
jgi:hypothetical protein